MTVRPLAAVEIKHPHLISHVRPPPPPPTQTLALVLFDLYYKVKGAMVARKRATPSLNLESTNATK